MYSFYSDPKHSDPKHSYDVGAEATTALGTLALINNVMARLLGMGALLGPYYFLAIAFATFVIAIASIIDNDVVDFTTDNNSTRMIKAMTTAASIGAALTLVPGVGLIGAVISISIMIHLLSAQLALLYLNL